MAILNNCPFCGQYEFDLEDCLHPSGTTWKYSADSECNIYGVHKQYPNKCYVLRCDCDVEMHGDSWDDVINKWNKREG